jgi:hypothetical protein
MNEERRSTMKRFFAISGLVICLGLFIAVPQGDAHMGHGYGYGMGPGMMGWGYGYGMGPRMMRGYGYSMGPCMMRGYGMSPGGMMAPGYGYCYGYRSGAKVKQHQEQMHEKKVQ